MKNSRRIIVKLLLPLILAIALVIGGYSWADARSHSASVNVSASVPSPTETLERSAMPLVVRRQRTRRKPVKNKQAEINYESIAQDIRLMLSWVESPEVTPAWLASKLRNYDCPGICTIEIRNDFNNPVVNAVNNSFVALKNEKFIYRINIASEEGSSSVRSVSIDLGFGGKPFLVDKLGKLLSNKTVRPIRTKYPSCDTGPCYIGRTRYFLDVDKKQSLSSLIKQYFVYIDVAVDSQKKLEYLGQISFEPK
jgi:hypothetical protein